MSNIYLKRTPQLVKAEIDLLLAQGTRFDVMNGTYTTKIIRPDSKLVLSNLRFPNKVFVAFQMVKRDCLKTELGQDIISRTHSKSNYDDNLRISHLKYESILNIDIKGAYASCLKNNGLIDHKTYEYLMLLPKQYRLPAVGMLARSYVHYMYDQGKLMDAELYRAETSQLFFYLISEIDILMREIKWILGKHFIFYWVDGVFFSPDTPASKIDEVESLLQSLNYGYRYEDIQDFEYTNIDGEITTSFVKNGERKAMVFRSKGKHESDVQKMLQDIAIQA
jgi:hypothetical protein